MAKGLTSDAKQHSAICLHKKYGMVDSCDNRQLQ